MDAQTWLRIANRKVSPVHAFGAGIATQTRISDYRDVGGALNEAVPAGVLLLEANLEHHPNTSRAPTSASDAPIARRGAKLTRWTALQSAGGGTRVQCDEEEEMKLPFLILTAAVLATPAAPQATAAKDPTLYTRLGGYDAVAAVTDDFVGRLAGDPSLGRFFKGHSTNSLGRIRQLIVDQLCNVTGGPCVYTGRDMKTTHAGLAITEADWQASVKHLVATLDKFKVPQKEKDEVLAAVSGLKKDIVERH